MTNRMKSVRDAISATTVVGEDGSVAVQASVTLACRVTPEDVGGGGEAVMMHAAVEAIMDYLYGAEEGSMEWSSDVVEEDGEPTDSATIDLDPIMADEACSDTGEYRPEHVLDLMCYADGTWEVSGGVWVGGASVDGTLEGARAEATNAARLIGRQISRAVGV